jgi:hypothetical protein
MLMKDKLRAVGFNELLDSVRSATPTLLKHMDVVNFNVVYFFFVFPESQFKCQI